MGLPGFRRTHQQALSAQAVALAAGPSGQLVTGFGEVAPLALMSGSTELLQAWVAETLGALADDDEHNARLRDTLRVFLQENGSYKTTAERLTLHKNTVLSRVRKAEECLRRQPAARTGPAGQPLAGPCGTASRRRAGPGRPQPAGPLKCTHDIPKRLGRSRTADRPW